MKKSTLKITFSLVLAFALIFQSCKKQGERYTIWRNITDNTMVNLYGAYMRLSALQDSMIFIGVSSAKVKGNLFNINDSLIVIKAGHCWSVYQNPTLNDSRYSTFDTTMFNQNDNEIEFVSYLKDLIIDTVYYVRTYAIIKNIATGRMDTAYNQVTTEFRTQLPEDVWFARNPFNGDNRTEAVSFVLHNTNPFTLTTEDVVFVALGYNGLKLLNDLWQYDAQNDAWTQLATYKGQPRYRAMAFSILDTAYVGGGLRVYHSDDADIIQDDIDGSIYKYSDFLYNNWTRTDSIPKGQERYDAVGFSVYSTAAHMWYGYIGMGATNFPRKDFIAFNYNLQSPDTTAWIGAGEYVYEVTEAVAMGVDDDIAVIGGGHNPLTGEYFNDFYAYQFQIAAQGYEPLGGISDTVPARADAVCGYIKEGERQYFYFGTGYNDTAYFNDWYAYDFTTKKWMVRSYIHEDLNIAKPRKGAVSFTFEKQHVEFGTTKRIYVGLGEAKDGALLKDMWEYLP